MFKLSSDRSFESLLEEIADPISESIVDAIEQMCKAMIEISPVDTGRFISNWDAEINKEGSDTFPESYSGEMESINRVKSSIYEYDITKDQFIYIYNNVYSNVDEEFYASIVSYDQSESVADEILEEGEEAVMDAIEKGLERFRGATSG